MTRKTPVKTRAREIQAATGIPYTLARRQAEAELGFTDVLERAAALPDGMTVDETVKYIVQHSTTRPVFRADFDPEEWTP